MAVSLTGTEKTEKMVAECDTGSSSSNMSLKSGRFFVRDISNGLDMYSFHVCEGHIIRFIVCLNVLWCE
jgi:hypothetical protein